MNHQQSPRQSNSFAPKSAFLLSQDHGESDKDMSAKFDLLSSASNLLTQSDTMDAGLQNLTQMIVECWELSFCRIFLLDDEATYLKTVALSPLPTNRNSFSWQAKVGEQTAVSDWPRLDELLAKHRSSVIKVTGKQGQHILKKWTQLLALEHDLQSQLVIPLRTHNKILGLLELGQLQSWEEAPFTPEKQRLAVAVAEQTAVHIDRMLLYEQTRRREELLTTLDETSRKIRAVKEHPKLLREVIRLAVNLADCTMGGLYINRPTLGELTLKEVYQFDENLIGSTLSHGQGLIGKTAVNKTTQFTNEYRTWPNREAIFAPYQFETFVAIPLKKENGELEAILFVADQEQKHRLSKMDIDILERFAQQAAIALQTSRSLGQEARIFNRLAILHRISDYVQTTADLNKTLRAILTGITAGYGLGFNRAVILLRDAARQNLVGRMGIGHFDAPDVYEDWHQDAQDGMNDFGYFIDHLEKNNLPPTPLETAVTDLILPITDNSNDLFAHILRQQASRQLKESDISSLPQKFCDIFQPHSPLAIIPFVVRQKAIGLLIVDNKFTDSQITYEDMELLRMFANTAALGIDRTQYLQKTKQSRDYFQTFSQASNALVMSDDPNKVWQTIMTQACEVAAANRVRMFLINEESCWAKDIIESGQNKSRELLPNSKAMQIMRTGEPGIINNEATEDEAGLTYMGNGAQATIGMPVSINGQRIGVMWFYYDDPRHFPQAEIEALQLYVNQAAIAYQNARRLKEVTHLHRAAAALNKADSMQEVLYQIVLNACQLLEADSAALFSYDKARNEFDPEYSVAYGIPDDIWKQSQKSGPRLDGTAHTIFQTGWIGVHNVKDKEKYRFLGSWTQGMLEEMGVHSFQAIALKLGDEQLGILYVNYKKIHAFFPEEQQIAQTFGNHAAQALRNAQLLLRVRKARKTAGIVANVSTLANLEETLFAITTGLHDALHCDVVSVHVYDELRERLLPLPTVCGAYYPERLNSVEKPNSPVVQLVQQKINRLIVPDVSVEPFFGGSRFSRDEEIVSTAVFLLQFGGHIVGALFVNYRQPHLFLGAELEDIELLANQAAVAIHNAQLYERTQQRAAALKALHEAGQAITSSLNRDTILQQIAAQACTLLNSPRREISYTSIWLVEEERYARVVATHPPEKLTQTQAVVGDVLDVYAAENGRRGIMSRVIQSGSYELVENVTTDPDYLATQISTTSEMVVPIISDEKVIGAINVEHGSIDAFDREDVTALESLAMQATIAIQNAHLFKQTEEQKVTLEALFKAGKALSRSLDLDTLLNEIVTQAFALTGAIGTHAQFSCLVMGNGEALEFVAAYPPERLTHLKREIGHMDLRVEERFGIIGRAFKTGKPQLVVDVREDGNYLVYDSKTRAELAVPLKIGKKVIGVINVEHPDKDVFDQLDRSALTSLAGQAVVAIQNAETHRETAILQKVSQAFAGELKKEQILKQVLEAAVELTHAPESSILFWDEDKKIYHPAYTIDSTGDAVPYQTTARKNGTTSKIMKTQDTIVINDVLKLPDANPTLTKKGRRSIVGVPVIRNGQVTAVLHVYSSEPNLFQEQQIKQLETLAGITGVALTKVQHYEALKKTNAELKKTKGMVGSRTALAWMGMASNAWRHNIEGDAVNIRNAADLLRLDVKKQVIDAETITLINQKLDLIHQLANQILDRPITPPLSSEEDVGLVLVNDLLRERTLQLWEDGKYAGLLKPIFKLEATKNIMVWASSEWLRRALDLVIDNAGDAMVTMPTKQLTIYTAVTNNQIQIAIQDTGRGIPEEIQEQLFTGNLNLPKREGHLGRGLLMVQAIMETYGGEVCVQASSSKGTVILLSLPVAEVKES